MEFRIPRGNSRCGSATSIFSRWEGWKLHPGCLGVLLLVRCLLHVRHCVHEFSHQLFGYVRAQTRPKVCLFAAAFWFFGCIYSDAVHVNDWWAELGRLLWSSYHSAWWWVYMHSLHSLHYLRSLAASRMCRLICLMSFLHHDRPCQCQCLIHPYPLKLRVDSTLQGPLRRDQHCDRCFCCSYWERAAFLQVFGEIWRVTVFSLSVMSQLFFSG